MGGSGSGGRSDGCVSPLEPTTAPGGALQRMGASVSLPELDGGGAPRLWPSLRAGPADGGGVGVPPSAGIRVGGGALAPSHSITAMPPLPPAPLVDGMPVVARGAGSGGGSSGGSSPRAGGTLLPSGTSSLAAADLAAARHAVQAGALQRSAARSDDDGKGAPTATVTAATTAAAGATAGSLGRTGTLAPARMLPISQESLPILHLSQESTSHYLQ